MLGTALAAGLVAAPGLTAPGSAEPAAAGFSLPSGCPPSAYPIAYSDRLDKQVVDGATIGGLSDLAYDRQRRAYASTVDNHDTDPSRVWFYRNLLFPHVVGSLVLKTPDGTPYTGATADNEGLAFLPDGDLLVSSETEPSIRVFGRDGVQRASLPVPARFAVAPAGEATANATLEGLSISPDGRTIVASMEGTLSGDQPADGGPANDRRFLVYTETHGRWTLKKQVGYAVDEGFRIAEVQQYAAGKLLVLEAAYAPATGNAVRLYAATGLDRAPDVSRVADLSTRPAEVLRKTAVADVTKCPSLGAPSKQVQTNPLLDNYEGMTTQRVLGPLYRVTLVSDDNFNPTQITRLLTLVARLP